MTELPLVSTVATLCAMPKVPSVTMNGGMPTTATSVPLTAPKQHADRQRAAAIANGKRIAGGNQQGGTHAAQAEQRAKAEIDTLGQDDQRHAERDDRSALRPATRRS